MSEDRKLNLVLIASGGGTDAEAIMSAWCNGGIPGVDITTLISTKDGAGCLNKAKKFDVDPFICTKVSKINRLLEARQTDMVFLVGCIKKVETYKVAPTFNIHPADPVRFGGDGMYGLEPHQRVMLDVRDQIERGKKGIEDVFYTYPTVHRVTSDIYDSGDAILTGSVIIPRRIIKELLDEEIEIGIAAGKLQQVVLPYEWAMLPAAVNMAVLEYRAINAEFESQLKL